MILQRNVRRVLRLFPRVSLDKVRGSVRVVFVEGELEEKSAR